MQPRNRHSSIRTGEEIFSEVEEPSPSLREEPDLREASSDLRPP